MISPSLEEGSSHVKGGVGGAPQLKGEVITLEGINCRGRDWFGLVVLCV